ncbi:hypothetical protein FRC12_007842 [Ceratobasidium sp. 428]|nr:hypothetical protein FRC12_007842 [Ceratobasidium sp. 428]
MLLACLADLLDAQDLSNQGVFQSFHPQANQTTAGKALTHFRITLHLFDTLIALLFPSARLPNERLIPTPKALVLQNCPTGKKELFATAAWVMANINSLSDTIPELMAKIIELPDSTPAASSLALAPSNKIAVVANILDHAVQFHHASKMTHAYMEQFSLLGRGLWNILQVENQRSDHAKKTLDFAIASSFVVPILRNHFSKVSFLHHDISVAATQQALDMLPLNMSSPLLVNCEEMMLFMTLNMLEQVYLGSSTAPIPNWLHLSAFLTNHSPSTPECWYYPEFRSSAPQVALLPAVLSITYPDNDDASNQDHQETSNVILPSADMEAPVPLASFFEVPGAAVVLTEGLLVAQPTGLDQPVLGEPLLQNPAQLHNPEDHLDEAALFALAQTLEELLGQDVTSNDLDQVAAKDLEDLASHEMTPAAGPTSTPLTSTPSGEEPENSGPDVSAELDPEPPTKDFSSDLTSSRDSSVLSDRQTRPNVPQMPLKHPRFETDPENTFRISNDNVEELKSFKRQVLDLPQVKGKYKTPKTQYPLWVDSILCGYHAPAWSFEVTTREFLVAQVNEQTHDWELVTTIDQQCQEDAPCLPADSTTTIHLTPAEVQSLTREELGDLFSTNNIVILPSQQPTTSSLWKTDDGEVTLQYLVDDNFVVQVHDLSHRSLLEGEHQNVSRWSTVWVVLDHINNDSGQVLNVLDLPDTTRAFPQPEAVFKLASDSFAFSSTWHMVQTFDQLPAWSASWILLAGAGAVTRNHVDAAGHATWVHMAAGAGKTWFIAVAPRDPSHHVFDSSQPWIDEEWNNCETPSELVKHFYWEAVYLPEGSTFIMQPHTIHLVLTLGPTLCHGGHFYSATTITRTLHARRLEHVHADTMSNETHPGSWMMLNRMMLFAARQMLLHKQQSPYPVDQLASLIILNQDPNFFRNPAEQSPSNYRYKLQVAKAAVAAKLVASSYPEVKVALQELTMRLAEWKDTLYEQWDDDLAVYQPRGATQIMQGGEQEQEGKVKGGVGEQSMDLDLGYFGQDEGMDEGDMNMDMD